MSALIIQKGSTSNQYVDNLEKSVKNPISSDTISNALDVLIDEGQQNTETYNYLKTNRNAIYAWGSKDHAFGSSAFEKIKNSVGDYICFIASNDIRYVAVIPLVNDIEDSSVNSRLAELFWGNSGWVNIWFLKQIRQINTTGINRDYIANTLELTDFSDIFTGSMMDNIRKLDEETYVSDKLNYLINKLWENSESIEVEPIETPERSRSENSRVLPLLNSKKQIILYGPPGTGKTFNTKEVAVKVIDNA